MFTNKSFSLSLLDIVLLCPILDGLVSHNLYNKVYVRECTHVVTAYRHLSHLHIKQQTQMELKYQTKE